MRATWKYRMATFDQKHLEKLLELLDDLGCFGWEVFHLDLQGGTVWLKKPN